MGGKIDKEGGEEGVEEEEVEQIKKRSRSRYFRSLLMNYDQLKRERSYGKILEGFTEGEISFLPTFKYNKGGSTFDSSKKQRIPSYTDRILYTPSSFSYSRNKNNSNNREKKKEIERRKKQINNNAK